MCLPSIFLPKTISCSSFSFMMIGIMISGSTFTPSLRSW